MNDIDFERAAVLLDVLAKCAVAGPSASAIAGEAGDELKIIHDACRENAIERANERAAEEAARVAPQGAKLEAAEEVDDDEEVDDTPIGRRA